MTRATFDSGRLASAALAAALALATATPATAEARNVVLVHGALLDGSGWRPVHDILVADGYHVGVVQMPLTSFDEDVAATRRVLDRMEGPVVLVGHSYGGVVITAAGDDPDVAALVYVAALQPEVGESLVTVSALAPAEQVDSAVTASEDGFLVIDPARFQELIGADLPDDLAAFMAASQAPTAASVFAAEVPVAAWHDTPAWAVIPTQDRTVSPDLQRLMSERSGATVTEVDASHMVALSQPQAVADVIEAAAAAVE